jgi:CheY-like chemotaxis protein
MPQILFVDDESSILTSLQRRLRKKADIWSMAFISSPDDAIAKVSQGGVDVVVADMAMPGMSGLEMIALMRSNSPHTRFIMLTGTADLQTAISAINDAEVFRFYTKPIETDHLMNGINQALEEKTNSTIGELIPPPTHGMGAVGIAALNHLAVAVIVTDAKARVRFANSVGGVLLSEQDGLTLSGQEICRASSVEETESLHKLIRSACLGDNKEDTPAISLSRPSGARPLAVVVLPVVSVIKVFGTEELIN